MIIPVLVPVLGTGGTKKSINEIREAEKAGFTV